MNALADVLPKPGQATTSTSAVAPRSSRALVDVRSMFLPPELASAMEEAATRLPNGAGYFHPIRTTEAVQAEAGARLAAIQRLLATPAPEKLVRRWLATLAHLAGNLPAPLDPVVTGLVAMLKLPACCYTRESMASLLRDSRGWWPNFHQLEQSLKPWADVWRDQGAQLELILADAAKAKRLASEAGSRGERPPAEVIRAKAAAAVEAIRKAASIYQRPAKGHNAPPPGALTFSDERLLCEYRKLEREYAGDEARLSPIRGRIAFLEAKLRRG